MSTLEQIEEFIQGCPPDGNFAVPNPNDPSTALTIEVRDLAGLVDAVREFHEYRDQVEQSGAYQAAVADGLSQYVAQLQQAGRPVDPNLLAIIEQADEGDEEYDPNVVSAVVTAMGAAGFNMDAAGAAALLDVINAASGQDEAPAAPQTFQSIGLSQQPVVFSGTPAPVARPRRVLVPGQAQRVQEAVPRAKAQEQSFLHPTPSPRAGSARPVSAEELFGVARNNNGRIDGGSLGVM